MQAESDLSTRFRALAAGLPDFAPGACPGDPAEYLGFYGLDVGEAYPQSRHSLGSVRSGSHRLAVHCWQSADAVATLYLVHGYFDHVGLYGNLVKFGLARGFNVVAFDLPGHGLSSGARGEIDDFADYRHALADVMKATGFLGVPRHVIAQSMGGAAVMDFLQCEDQDSFDGVVLLAPLVWPVNWRRVALTWLLLHRLVDSVPRRFADNSQDREFLEFLQQDPLQQRIIPVSWVGALRRWLRSFLARRACDKPLMVIQGDSDTTVAWRRNLVQIRRLFPNMQLHMVRGGRHHLANESGELRKAYLEVVATFLDMEKPG